MTFLFPKTMSPAARRPAARRATRRLAVVALAWSAACAGPAALAAGQPLPAGPAASAGVPMDPNEPGDRKPPVRNSDLDAALMYRLIVGELARVERQPADAIEIYVDTARQTQDDQLWLRAVQIAIEAGSGDKALEVSRSWRKSMPKSTAAITAEMQLLFVLDRVPETAEPLRALLALSSGAERSAVIASLPRAASRARDKAAVSAQFQQLLAPYLDLPDTRVAARVALARLRLAEGQTAAALALAHQASESDPGAEPVAWLALELMTQPGAQPSSGQPGDRSAEAIVRRYLERPEPDPVIRQALAALLTRQQRLAEAAVQVRLAAQARPQQVMLWLSLGELEIELKHPDAADEALRKALDLALAAEAGRKAPAAGASAPAGAGAPSTARDDDADDDDDDDDARADRDTAGVHADASPAARRARPARIYLLLARSAQLRKDDAASRQWLEKIPPQDADLSVLSLRAGLLARAGKVKEARQLIESAPAESDEARRLKVLTEVQFLREHKQLAEAQKVLVRANAAQPDDVDLLYEQAMVDEQLDKLDEMERLLRQVLKLQPDHAQALNALGYSLADRRLRLEEALQLVSRAHELAPGDPFIVDSLGWVEFRLGHYPEAIRWLRQAYGARTDTEIAAHLAEALWAQGQRDEARRIFEEARARDGANPVLRETLRRLKVPTVEGRR